MSQNADKQNASIKSSKNEKNLACLGMRGEETVSLIFVVVVVVANSQKVHMAKSAYVAINLNCTTDW